MTKKSRLYTFLDDKNGFTFSILDGRELIAELATLQRLQTNGFNYFRNAVLTTLPMISFLKNGEGFGLYIDSEVPHFRLKIEANSAGNMRTLLYPENFDEFPDTLRGVGRLSKIFDKIPYNSIIQLDGMGLSDVVNSILKNSYQVQSEVHLIQDADFSILLMKLPAINVNKIDAEKRLDPLPYWEMQKSAIHQILIKDPTEEEIITEITSLGVEYLHGKDIQFHCPCSKERMILNLKNLLSTSANEDLFDLHSNTLNAHCEYCNKDYTITRNELGVTN